MNIDWSTIVEGNQSPLKTQDLIRLEERLGVSLPSDYRQFLLRFNGGRVVVEHKLSVPETPFDLGVEYLSPLTAPPPGMGVVEARDLQEATRMCLKEVLSIGHDGGTGDYYLILSG